MAEHETIAAALVAALADLTVVEKGRTAKIQTNKGRDYEYEYADIGDVVKLTRPVLAEHGLVALTPIHDHGGELACTVTLLHTSGERLDLGPFPFPHGRDAQSTGSAVTYHRRYALVAALGMAAGDDDDGAHATASSRQPAKPERPGRSVADAKTELVKLCAGTVPGSTEKEHAKAIWEQSELTGDWVTPEDWQVVKAVADAYLADLTEMAGAGA